MKVTCLATSLNVEQHAAMHMSERNHPSFDLTVGCAYTVLGITAHHQSTYWTGTLLQVPDDFNRCMFVPVCLFAIADPRPSRYWRARLLDMYTLTLWPEEFYSEYFHDDLSEYVPAVVAVFQRVRRLLDDEFADLPE